MSVAMESSQTEKFRHTYQRIACDLAWQTSDSGQHLKLEVISQSMYPTLKPGDKVIVQKSNPDSFHIGDILVVWRKGEFVTHRLVALSAAGWYTKGDHCRNMDLPVGTGAILGKVIAIHRQNQSIDLQSLIWKIANPILGHIHRWIGTIFRILRIIKLGLRRIAS